MIRTIRLKDLIKYLVGLIIAIGVAIYSTRFFSNIKWSGSILSANISPINIIKNNILLFKKDDDDIEEVKIAKMSSKVTSRSGILRVLDMELPQIDETNKNVQEDNTNEEEDEEERQTVQIKDTYSNTYGSVTVKNLTDIKLTEEILKPDYNVKNKNDILIFHTHTCESYTPTKANSYEASGNYRTTDLDYSVVSVGRELKEKLRKFKFNVTQNETKHDYPAYSGSYTRSLKTVEEMLEENKDAEILFDVHRDAVGSNSNYAPTVEINGEKVAQLMFVVGTNDGGGKHPNWKNNLKFAVKVQEKANEMYPGLFRSINLRSATFNQRVTNAATIVEVGATGNTLEEAKASMKYFAEVLNEVLK